MALDIEKTIQAASVLLEGTEGRSMSYLRLLKLLYLADREMLRRTGLPITCDRVVAMKHGPVLSETYNLIKGEHLLAGRWNQFIERHEYKVKRTESEPGRANLSRLAITVLNEVNEQHDHLGDWDLVDHMHRTLPEWKENWPGEEANGKSIPVQYEDILRALEFDEEDVQILASEIRALRQLEVGRN